MTLWISKIGMHFMSSNQWTRWLTSRLPILVSLIKMLSTDWRMNNPVDNQKQGMKMLRDCRRSTENLSTSLHHQIHTLTVFALRQILFICFIQLQLRFEKRQKSRNQRNRTNFYRATSWIIFSSISLTFFLFSCPTCTWKKTDRNICVNETIRVKLRLTRW